MYTMKCLIQIKHKFKYLEMVLGPDTASADPFVNSSHSLTSAENKQYTGAVVSVGLFTTIRYRDIFN